MDQIKYIHKIVLLTCKGSDSTPKTPITYQESHEK